MRTVNLAFVCLLSALSVPFAGYAQVVDVSDCRGIDNLEKRLACYDRLTGEERSPAAAEVERARDAESPRENQPRAAAAYAPARRTSVNAVARDDDKAELTGTVASLEQYGPQLWLIALDSGQRWRQTIGKTYRLNVGDQVRVYPTRWGEAYRLSSERISGYIQVVRVD